VGSEYADFAEIHHLKFINLLFLNVISQFETFEDPSPFSRERTIFKDSICDEKFDTYRML